MNKMSISRKLKQNTLNENETIIRWLGTKLEHASPILVDKQFGTTVKIHAKVIIRFNNQTILNRVMNIKEQSPPSLTNETNVWIRRNPISLNVWFYDNQPVYVILKYNSYAYSTNKGKIKSDNSLSFLQKTGQWTVQGKFKYGSNYTQLNKPIDFTVMVELC